MLYLSLQGLATSQGSKKVYRDFNGEYKGLKQESTVWFIIQLTLLHAI